MMNRALQLYQHLPAPAQALAANLRGLYLRNWRYGDETDRLVKEALERDSWSREQWQTWQEDQLARVLHRAATQVPYYREQWSVRRQKGDKASWEYLENWPVLDKEPLRENPKAFLAEGCDARRMFHEHTSGTTGKSLDLWWSRQTVRSWYALFEARCRAWYGLSRNDRWAILGGQVVTPVRRRKAPFWVWNAALNQLYMSSYHLAPDLIPHYLEALIRYRVRYVLGYTSSLYELAQCVLQSGRRDLKIAVALCNAEPVFDYQRQTIEEAFQCPVRETYGMAEAVAAASECNAGRLHLWPEAGKIEVIEDGTTVPNGISGALVCTGLMNSDMPLVRYQVGDRGALSSSPDQCDCGRLLPVLDSIEGRIDDILYTPDGRRIGRLDPVFKSGLPIKEAQIIQEKLDLIRIRYVPVHGFDQSAEHSIIERLQTRMGDVKVILEPVDKVPRGTNGKFRAVICNLSAEERLRLKSQLAQRSACD